MSERNLNLLKTKTTIVRPADNHKGQIATKKTTSGSDKLSRQDIIIDSIKDGGLYSIKDIISRISSTHKDIDCSEKTIQRDLIHLVLNKTLVKQGERRWSRYSFSGAVVKNHVDNLSHE